MEGGWGTRKRVRRIPRAARTASPKSRWTGFSSPAVQRKLPTSHDAGNPAAQGSIVRSSTPRTSADHIRPQHRPLAPEGAAVLRETVGAEGVGFAQCAADGDRTGMVVPMRMSLTARSTQLCATRAHRPPRGCLPPRCASCSPPARRQTARCGRSRPPGR